MANIFGSNPKDQGSSPWWRAKYGTVAQLVEHCVEAAGYCLALVRFQSVPQHSLVD